MTGIILDVEYRSQQDGNPVLKGLHSSWGVEQTVEKWNLSWIVIHALVKNKAATDTGVWGGGCYLKYIGKLKSEQRSEDWERRIHAATWGKCIPSRESRKFCPQPGHSWFCLVRMASGRYSWCTCSACRLRHLLSVPRSAWSATCTLVSKVEATFQPSHLCDTSWVHTDMTEDTLRVASSAENAGPVGSLSERGRREET